MCTYKSRAFHIFRVSLFAFHKHYNNYRKNNTKQKRNYISRGIINERATLLGEIEKGSTLLHSARVYAILIKLICPLFLALA